ncbi:MAG: dephospho-CoA kinase [Nanoarchaeota archaeon]|nr:dephospho-CoA kinase [Nanoarchaeota archaeon]
MKIGITGVFGSGKTTIAKLFTNYKHINADLIGHRLLNERSIKNKIIKTFGKSLLTKNKIDRKKLKNIVFNNHKELIKLNKIIHPPIINEIKAIIKKDKTIIIDGALLIETRSTKLFDKLIVVKINKKEQLKRVLRKKKYTKREIQNILKSQLSQKEKLKYADIVIDNSKGVNNTKKQVVKILKELK